jgi:hypothetical protein
MQTLTLFPLKVLIPCEKCSWYKILIMIFWRGWRSPTPSNPKIHCFLVGGIGGYRFYFLLNLQLKWNALWLISMWKNKVLMAWALLTKAMFLVNFFETNRKFHIQIVAISLKMTSCKIMSKKIKWKRVKNQNSMDKTILFFSTMSFSP